MKSYLKFLSRNMLYTAIEAVGLVLSLAFVIVIATSVRDQKRLSRPGPGQENLYLLGKPENYRFEYSNLEALSSMPEVIRTAAFMSSNNMIQVAGEKYRSQVLVADPALLDMIPLALRSGERSSFDAGPGVMITETAARKYFSDRDPLGQTFLVGDVMGTEGEKAVPEPLQICAVIQDPSFTLLDDFEFLVCIRNSTPYVRRYRESDMRRTSTGRMMAALVELAPGTDLQAFSDKLAPQVFWFSRKELREGMMVTPLENLYFSDDSISGVRQGRRLYLQVLILLGLILLASAVLNYTNLSLAVSGSRAREMATRQLVGEDRQGVLIRALKESLLFTLVCYVLAVLLAFAMVPLLDSLRPEGMTARFRVVMDGGFWLMSLVLVAGIGILAGFFPALMLASWRPMDVVSGRLRRQRKMVFNRISTTVQAAFALVLIIMSITLYAQLRHLETLDLGVTPAENVFCYMQSFASMDDALVDRLAASPLVEEIGTSFGLPTHSLRITVFKRDVMLNPIDCDSTAFRLLGFRPIEVRAGMIPNALWLSEEEYNYLRGESGEDVEAILSRWGKGVPFGGILENYRKTPVNEKDNFDLGPKARFLYAVSIFRPRTLEGLVIRTGPDRRAFERFFKETVNNYYKETLAFGDVLSNDANYAYCGYFDEIIAKDYDDLRRYVRLVEFFCLMAVLLAMLGLLAMSTYYAGAKSKDIAIRKVFGGTVESETGRGVASFMLWTLLAAVVGVPVGVVAVGRFLQGWPERIGGCWWIFVVAVMLLLTVSFLSVLWQTLRAARTNPATELKKE